MPFFSNGETQVHIDGFSMHTVVLIMKSAVCSVYCLVHYSVQYVYRAVCSEQLCVSVIVQCNSSLSGNKKPVCGRSQKGN